MLQDQLCQTFINQSYQAHLDKIISYLLITENVASSAKNLAKIFTSLSPTIVLDQLNYLKKSHDVSISGQTELSKYKKACDYRIWIKRLRKKLHHYQEQQARADDTFYVCTDTAVTRKQLTDEAQQTYLIRQGHLEATNDAVEIGLDKKRRSDYAEKLARSIGIQNRAEQSGLKSLFLTITCPSRFHDIENGLTPLDANRYLIKQWKLFRASMKKRTIAFEFIRTVEPHKNGTPHWHLMLWVSNKSQTIKLLNKYFVDTEAYAKGNNKRLFVSKNTEKAVYYLLKQFKAKTNTGEVNKYSERARGWSHLWRIRAFDTSSSEITVYRQLRRSSTVHPDLKEAKSACITGNYAEFLALNKTLKVKTTYKTKLNRYGETVHILNGLAINNSHYQLKKGGKNKPEKVTLRIKTPSIIVFKLVMFFRWSIIPRHILRIMCRGPPS